MNTGMGKPTAKEVAHGRRGKLFVWDLAQSGRWTSSAGELVCNGGRKLPCKRLVHNGRGKLSSEELKHNRV